MMINCPECDAVVVVATDVMMGEILPCADCGAELEVVATEPTVCLALAPEVEEDWGE